MVDFIFKEKLKETKHLLYQDIEHITFEHLVQFGSCQFTVSLGSESKIQGARYLKTYISYLCKAFD